MLGRAWERINGEAERLEEKDREVSARERRVRAEEAEAARRGPRVIPDPEGGSPPTDEEGRSLSLKRARGGSGEGGLLRRKRRCVEGRERTGVTGAPRPRCPSPQPTPTDRGSASPRRGILRGGSRVQSGGGGWRRWRSCSAM